MSKVFISYRRADSRPYTERIHDRLVLKYGKDNVFLDVDNSIPAGMPFRDVLTAKLAESDVVVVIIGPRWLDIREDNDLDKRRLDNPDDFVRLELEESLRHPYATIIPVLVNQASMPAARDLPEAVVPLAGIQASAVRENPDFHDDMNGLEAIIQRGVERSQQRRTAQRQVAPPGADAMSALLGISPDALDSHRTGQLHGAERTSAQAALKSVQLRIWMLYIFGIGTAIMLTIVTTLYLGAENQLQTYISVVATLVASLLIYGIIAYNMLKFSLRLNAATLKVLETRLNASWKQGILGDIRAEGERLHFAVDDWPFSTRIDPATFDLDVFRAFEGRLVRAYLRYSPTGADSLRVPVPDEANRNHAFTLRYDFLSIETRER